MGAYLEPIKTAIFAFPILAFIVSLPIFLYQYYKHGTFLRWYAIVIYSFILYVLVAYFLVILPLPDRESVAKLTTPRYNLHPMQIVRSFIHETSLISHSKKYCYCYLKIGFIKNLSILSPIII